MDPEIKAMITAMIASTFGFLFSFFSPIRDPVANYTIVLGFLLTTILLVSNFLFRIFVVFRRTHPIFFTIKILNLILSVVIVIGIILGRLVGIWSPFWFLPFGYYIFLSACVNYILFYDIKQLFVLYQQTQLGRRIMEDGIVKVKQVSDVETEKCECGREVQSSFLFCPFCGRVLRKDE